jgi:DnaK suppressor protein
MNIEHFKEKLTKEQERLHKELRAIGRPTGGDEWVAKDTTQVDPADDTEMADKFEELSLNESVVGNLERQLKDVDHALENIEANNYGICETCNEPIEEDRLEANPSARTCKAHMNG